MGSAGVPVSGTGTVLRNLLRARARARPFCVLPGVRQAAGTIDRALIGHSPSRARFYRWLSGELVGLPHADHCRVLERMFPGYDVQRLLSPSSADSDLSSSASGTIRRTTSVRDTPTAVAVGRAQGVAAFSTRSAFLEAVPPQALFDRARDVRAMGLSLNLLCQQYADDQLRGLVDGGAELRCLFLDPAGAAIAAREQEEGHSKGTLSNLTAVNLQVMTRLRDRLGGDARARMLVRGYDEVVRFNILLVDGRRCVVQPYLPTTRGIDSPTFVADRGGSEGIVDVFAGVFDSVWDRAVDHG